jgi:hypothetical protein
MSDYTALMHHFKSIHNFIHVGRSIKHVELEPDIHDPNFFCQVCQIKFKFSGVYMIHLERIHFIHTNSSGLCPKEKLGAPYLNKFNLFLCACKAEYGTRSEYDNHLKTCTRSTRKTHNLPNWNDPSNHCKPCGRFYATANTFRAHCRAIHSMTPPVKTKSSNRHCDTCDMSSKSRKKLRIHLYKMHGLQELSQLKRNAKHIEPNINHCEDCEKTFYNNEYYKRHMHKAHSVPLPKEKIKLRGAVEYIDLEDPYNYCRICKRKYGNRQFYLNHLQKIHKIQFDSLEKHDYSDPKFFPDPFDPKFYCRVCKSTHSSMFSYRCHCRYIHRMESVIVKKFKNPDAKVDFNNPDSYCAICDRNYRGGDENERFKEHLKDVHGLVENQLVSESKPVINDFYYCRECRIRIKSKYMFIRHFKRIHKRTLSQEDLENREK